MTIDEAMRGFKKYLSLRRAEYTVISYTTALNHFRHFLEHMGIDPVCEECKEIVPDTLMAFLSWLGADGCIQRETLDHYSIGAFRFYRWLLMEGHAGFDGSEFARLQERLSDLRGHKVRRKIPKVPREEDVQGVITKARAGRIEGTPLQQMVAMRNAALLESLRSTGARIGELLNLRVKSLNDHSALVMGKGSRERHIYFDEKAWQALQVYLEHRELAPDQVVFAAHHGIDSDPTSPLRRSSVDYHLHKLQEAVGSEHFTPHQFRHRFATRALKQTKRLEIVQDLLGHAKPDTTRIYAQVDNEELVEAFHTVDL